MLYPQRPSASVQCCCSTSHQQPQPVAAVLARRTHRVHQSASSSSSQADGAPSFSRRALFAGIAGVAIAGQLARPEQAEARELGGAGNDGEQPCLVAHGAEVWIHALRTGDTRPASAASPHPPTALPPLPSLCADIIATRVRAYDSDADGYMDPQEIRAAYKEVGAAGQA